MCNTKSHFNGSFLFCFVLIIRTHAKISIQFSVCIIPTPINITCVIKSGVRSGNILMCNFIQYFVGNPFGLSLKKMFQFRLSGIVYALVWMAVGGFHFELSFRCSFRYQAWTARERENEGAASTYMCMYGCNGNCIKFSNYQDNLC